MLRLPPLQMIAAARPVLPSAERSAKTASAAEALSASAALGITMIGFNMLGDGLRDVTAPQGRN